MGVREAYELESEKNIKLELEVANFNNISYWIRSLKYRFQKDKIKKIKLSIDIVYIPHESTNEWVDKYYK